MTWPNNGPDFLDAVSFGVAPGYIRVGNFGHNPDVDINTVPEDAWTNGGRYPWMLAATTLRVKSTSAADSPAGTGVASVTINGLDIAFNAISQTIILNGITPVAVPIDLYRINSVRSVSVGSAAVIAIGAANAGDITVEDVAGPNTVRAIIPTGYGGTRQAPYTVPAGQALLVKQILLDVKSPSGSVGQYARLSTYFKTVAGVISQPIEFGDTSGGPYPHNIDPPILVTAGMDFSLLLTNTSDNNTAITGAWNGYQRML